MDDLEIEANIITSVYGKDNFNNFIANNAKENAVIYWNKEKSQELTKTPGIRFPDNLSSLDSNVIIRKAKAFVNSDKQNFIQTQRSTVLYWNKEKSQELIDVPGIQFPDKINSLDSNVIIRKAKDFVNSF